MSTHPPLNRLVFSPKDADYSPAAPQQDSAALINALRKIQFIGDSLPTSHKSQEQGQRFLVGDQFFQLMTFLGCSPNIEIEPREDMAFCHVEIPEPGPQHSLIASRTLKPPVCPQCRNALAHWRELGEHDTSVTCPQCSHKALFSQYIWRRKAMSFARWHVSLWNIYESEAVPVPELLNAFEAATDTAWTYSYITA